MGFECLVEDVTSYVHSDIGSLGSSSHKLSGIKEFLISVDNIALRHPRNTSSLAELIADALSDDEDYTSVSFLSPGNSCVIEGWSANHSDQPLWKASFDGLNLHYMRVTGRSGYDSEVFCHLLECLGEHLSSMYFGDYKKQHMN